MNKKCSKCSVEKPTDSFYKRSPKAGGGLEAFCKECKHLYYKRNRRWGHLQERYGLSENQYNIMSEKQQGKCWICLKNNKDSVLVVDHCHSSGNVRGLLCRQCNAGLGLLGDTIESVQKAMNYLRNYDESIKA